MNATNTQKIEAAEMLLKDTQVILAALKAETEPKREPKLRDVYTDNRGRLGILAKHYGHEYEGSFLVDEKQGDTYGTASSMGNWSWENYRDHGTYLGTFDEVYMLRSEGISKKDLRDYIGAIYTRGEGCTAYDLKTAITGKFNLNGK